MPVILLLGGARSGKSALAVDLAKRSGAPVTFVATAEAGDSEMADRIAQHRRERPAAWMTVEEPLALIEAVAAAPRSDLLVVDCLTLWVSNLIGRGQPSSAIEAMALDAAGALASRTATAIVVSNEVGLGIVPDNPLARSYRDLLGRVNSLFAENAERVLVVVAGRIHELASAADFMEGMQWQPR